MNFLASRTQKFFNSTSFLLKFANKLSELKAYNPIDEKDGFVDLGISENRLMLDILSEKFKEEEMQTWLPPYQFYYNHKGILALREALADFFQERFVKNNNAVTIRPSDLSIVNGASSCFTVLSYCIANQNDYILIETPYYSAISFDINCLTDNHVYFVHTKRENNFVATLNDYEIAFENAKSENKKVSAIIIVNPGNPIGNLSNKERLLNLLNFAKVRELHVIVDEIYANCVYDSKLEFQSILSYFDEIPDPLRTHFMWSFSKDLCSAGMRCGVIYSQNEYLIQAISKMGLIFSTPYIAQHKLTLILNDKAWLNKFFEVNHNRMLNSKEIITRELTKLSVKCMDTCSGFFLWADFRFVFSSTLDQSEITFQKEMILFEIFFKNGLYIVPGQALSCIEPGWFRIVFCAPECILMEAAIRIRKSIIEFHEV